MITYRELTVSDMEESLFDAFDRTQVVTKCWRKIDDEWCVKDVSFVDNWTQDDYRDNILDLKHVIETGGYAVGAFYDDKLKGFLSVEAALFGVTARYVDLSGIHVSSDMRGRGIGRELFCRAKVWAKAHGAEKLYISAQSSVESQAFYKAMGCVEAKEYSQRLVEKEPYDCQLEYVL